MQCPRCGQGDLDPVAFDRHTQAHWCTTCGGAWYAEGDLERALHVDTPIRVSAEGTDQKASIPCPTCQVAMAELTWPPDSSTRVDACPSCGGTWLDRGELEAIRARLSNLGRADPPAERTPLRDRTVALPDPAQIVRHMQWGWVALGAVAMFVAYGFVLGALRFGALFDAMSSHGTSTGTSTLGLMAGLLAFPIGGVLIGRSSEGFTLWEAGLAAIPVAGLMGWSAHGQLGQGALFALVLAGFVLAMAGALVGERAQAS